MYKDWRQIMNKKVIFEIPSIYRDNFRVTGYEFGEGEKSVCIVGSMRGNEVQQMYACSKVIKRLKRMESEGRIKKGHKILVIPNINPYSMNIKKRFWSTDNTDINRMFPGYNLGETTQRIADGVFKVIKDYKFGIQFASFYMPGKFTPHIRMMKAGYESVDLAKQFGLPYVVLRNVRPYDTTTLNYNWQCWETHGFSLYTTTTNEIDKESAGQAVRAIMTFLAKQGIVEYTGHDGYKSLVIDDKDLISVRTKKSGLFNAKVKVGCEVVRGQVLAEIIHPYEGEVIAELKSPVDGIVFFEHDEPLTYANTAVFKLLEREV